MHLKPLNYHVTTKGYLFYLSALTTTDSKGKYNSASLEICKIYLNKDTKQE